MAVAVGNLVECRPMRKEDEAAAFILYRPSLYAHVYQNVKPIKPFIFKGAQRRKKISDEDLHKVELL